MPGNPRRFALLLVKPSHYDDDGYVIQWFRSAIPSNSLAALLRARARLRRAPRARRRRRDRDPRLRRDQYPHPPRSPGPDDRGRRRRHGHAGRRAVQSVSPRARSCPPVARSAASRSASAGSMSPARSRCCDGVDPDLARARGARRIAVRGRGRGPLRRSAARCLRGPAQAALQLHGRSARDRGRADSAAAARAGEAHRRRGHQLRCRARLSLPVLVLHHHQRAGPQVAPALARRHRIAGARQPGAGPQSLLHHRRQFRPQQGLGADPRPPDPVARAGRAEVQHHHPGRYAVPQAAELHREVRARRRQARLHRPGEHQSREPGRCQEEAEQDHRIPQDAAGLEAGRGF